MLTKTEVFVNDMSLLKEISLPCRSFEVLDTPVKVHPHLCAFMQLLEYVPETAIAFDLRTEVNILFFDRPKYLMCPGME